MRDFNLDNHNSNFNPHSQYDVGKQYIYPYVASATNNIAYTKVGSFLISTDISKLPQTMKFNVVKSATVEFDLQDVSTFSATFSSSVFLDIRQGPDKTKPLIRLKHTFPTDVSNDVVSQRKIILKLTSYPDYMAEDGQVPNVVDVYVSTVLYGKLSLTPKKLNINGYTWNNNIGLGNLTSKNSTMIQKFDDFIGNNLTGSLLSEAEVLSLSTNQQVVYPDVVIGGETFIVADNDFDFNNISRNYPNRITVSVNKKTALNAPFDNTLLYYVEHRSLVNGWSVQIARAHNGTVKTRNFTGSWEQWG